MSQILRWSNLLCGLCFFVFAFPVNGKDFEREAAHLFEKRFHEKTIDGTGHVFSIVVECDGNRLKLISDKLQKEQTEIFEYDFIFEINSQQKAQSRILGGGLDKVVETCIINRYHKDVMFTPFTPAIMQDRIRFPVVLVKDKPPFAPRTQIGFISEEGEER